MKRLGKAVLFASLCSSLVCAQNPAPASPTDPSLKEVLVTRVDSFMSAWKKQDAAALTAILAPEFLYVSSRGATGREGIVAALTHACTLTSYTVSDVQLVRISSESAALVYKIHQNSSCAGHPDPPVALNTDTLVRREGKWVFLLTTSTAAE